MPTIVQFPSRLVSPSDRAELMRWGSVAPSIANWWVQQDPDTGRTIETTEDGGEYAVLVQGGPHEPGGYVVAPHRGRWELEHWRDGPMGSFRTLREALESICRTIRDAA